jgi:hypothetical protein
VGAVIVSLGLLAGAALTTTKRSLPQAPHAPAHPYVARPRGTVTFAKDIAPIVFKNCTVCHRPGQVAPFALTSYKDVKKHAPQIAEVTARRFMPPWLPEPGCVEYANQRQLTTDEIGLIAQWVDEGAVEGDSAQTPPPPTWAEGWQLGKPDLVVPMPWAYTLPPDGKDVYRNFVFPIPVPQSRYVKAVELLPGNPKVVHHAFITVDESRQSRRLAEKENPPGFDGMNLPQSAVMPGGQFLGWHPGQLPLASPDGMAWLLRTNTDLVLQLHMHPTGKPETVAPKLGFYFTDQAPTNTPFRIRLCRYDIDIPAGASDYTIERSYTLPVDVSLLRISPHAHYLAKEMQGYAVLPGGERQWLLQIKDWDFNWQGDYEFKHPISLPHGTRLAMRFTYDNTTNNVRNPNVPPKRVGYGLQTTDEMGELWFQALAATPEDLTRLSNDYLEFLNQENVEYCNYLLRVNPNDAQAHVRLGRTLHAQGKMAESLEHLQRAVALDPNNDHAHYELGYLFLRTQRLNDAGREFQTVIRLNPQDYQAYGSLGYICMVNGRADNARACFEAALRLNPEDSVSRRNLELLQKQP